MVYNRISESIKESSIIPIIPEKGDLFDPNYHEATEASEDKNFGKDEVKSFFNSNGLRWGNDSNAYTNIESTMYFFKVKPDTLDRGLQLMADWANGDIVFFYTP